MPSVTDLTAFLEAYCTLRSEARATNPDGRRRRKFVTVKGKKSDAQRRMRELLTSMDHGLPLTNERATVSEWTDRWLREHVAPNRRQRTTERYRDIARKHIKPHIGHVQLTKLTPSDIKALEADWASQGMSPTGVQYAHRILSAALKVAVKMELLYRNPAQVVDPPRVEKGEVQPPSVTTVNMVLEVSESRADALYPALRLIAYSGIRRGECSGLHWQHADFARQEITIVSWLVRSAEKGHILEPPKSKASSRVIDLDEGTMEILRRHKVRQMEHRLILAGSYEDNDLVFPNGFGKFLNPMALTRALNGAESQLGAKHMKLTRPSALPRQPATSKRPEPRPGEQEARTLDG